MNIHIVSPLNSNAKIQKIFEQIKMVYGFMINVDYYAKLNVKITMPIKSERNSLVDKTVYQLVETIIWSRIFLDCFVSQ